MGGYHPPGSTWIGGGPTSVPRPPFGEGGGIYKDLYARVTKYHEIRATIKIIDRVQIRLVAEE
jgi:hypothetical protein